jgi:hypothetical protein
VLERGLRQLVSVVKLALRILGDQRASVTLGDLVLA